MAETASSSTSTWTSKFNNIIDGGTAMVCRDIKGPTVLKKPERKRAIVRLVVVLTVLAFTIWAVEWIAVNASGFHIKEVAYNSKEAQAYFRPVPAGSFADASRDGMIPNISCPCLAESSFTWCSFTHFYLIECNEKTNYQPKATVNLTANTNSCKSRPLDINDLACHNASDVVGCSTALDAVYDFADTKTYIETSNLASPFELYDLVSTNMQSNVYSNNRTIYNKLEESPNKSSSNHSILVMLLVQSMVAQVFNCNTVSTDQQFWDRGNVCAWNLYPEVAAQSFNGSKFAFGMTIDYDVYSTRCQPKHCYIFVKDDFHTRLLRAMGEVGGVAGLILVGIRMLLWPLVAMICRFPRAPGVDPAGVASSVYEHFGNS